MFKLILIYDLSKTSAIEIKQDHIEFNTDGHYPDCSDGHRPEKNYVHTYHIMRFGLKNALCSQKDAKLNF